MSTKNHWEIAEYFPRLDAFRDVPVLSKKEVGKIKPGTWIEVKWADAPNQAVLLVERMNPKETGEVSLRYFDPDSCSIRLQATNRQVVRVLGPLQVPAVAGSAVPQ
jgi:hypothetical protein